MVLLQQDTLYTSNSVDRKGSPESLGWERERGNWEEYGYASGRDSNDHRDDIAVLIMKGSRLREHRRGSAWLLLAWPVVKKYSDQVPPQ